MGVNSSFAHVYYSRFLRLGYGGKFTHIQERLSDWKLQVWAMNFGFYPNLIGIRKSSYRYMLQYFIICILLFLMSFFLEYFNYRRFNLQAKVLRDHNPLIHRKGL